MKWFSMALALGLAACAGKTVVESDAGLGREGGPDGGGLSDVVMPDSGAGDATPDCGQPPQTVYSCIAEDGGACHRYGGPHDSAEDAASFPLGCMVTLPICEGFFPGAQTCDCQNFPGDDAGAQWICPM